MTAPQLLREEMKFVRHIEKIVMGYGYVKKTKEYNHAFDIELAYHRKFGFTIEK